MSNPSTANAHEQLLQRLLDNLPSGYTSASLKLPNRHFNVPSASKWMRGTVINQDVANVQAGGLWKRYDGVFVVDLFYPIGDDVIAQLTEAELIATTFENVAFNGVNCLDVLIVDNQDDGSWYNVQITIDFYYEGA
jgi:hypothetical protein